MTIRPADQRGPDRRHPVLLRFEDDLLVGDEIVRDRHLRALLRWASIVARARRGRRAVAGPFREPRLSSARDRAARRSTADRGRRLRTARCRASRGWSLPARRAHRHGRHGHRPSRPRHEARPHRSPSSCSVARSRPTPTSPCASDARRSRRPSCAIRTSSPAWRPARTAASRTSSWSSSRARTSPPVFDGTAGSRRPRPPGSGSTSLGRSRVAHVRGIVHRDVKPGNILLARDGRAMVTDFGIARLAADTEGAVPGTTLGSVHYFSPEQATGATTTPASDVYSLGLVLYESLTGRRAWSGETTAVARGGAGRAARRLRRATSGRRSRPRSTRSSGARWTRNRTAATRTGRPWRRRSSRLSPGRIRSARPRPTTRPPSRQRQPVRQPAEPRWASPP